MPAIRKRRTQASVSERAIQEAMDDYRSKKYTTLRAAASAHDIPPTTLHGRLKGAKSQSKSHTEQALLTEEQEEAIVRFCLKVDGWGNPLKLPYVYALATHMEPTHKRPGKHWISRFLNRHPVLASKIASRLDRQRATADDPKVLAHFFKLLAKILKDFKIKPCNIWNIDEKGFMRGKAMKCKVICSRQRKNPRLAQSGDREMITVIEGVSAAGALLQPMIVYKGKLHVTGWYSFVSCNEQAVFAYSDRGWTDNELGVEYLERVFEPGTSSIANGDTRLLILDGHGSHLSPEFLIYAVEHNIIVLCLPPHTSHLIQPLDVGLFATLQRHYSSQLDEWTSHGLFNVQKAEFFKLLVTARAKTYTQQAIQRAFETTGIWPVNSRKVLAAPVRNQPSENHGSPSTNNNPLLRTPTKSREVAKLAQYLQSLIPATTASANEELQVGISKLSKAAQRSDADHDIEAFRHQQTRMLLHNRSKKSIKDRTILTRARVITNFDIVQLKEQQNCQDVKRAAVKARRLQMLGKKKQPQRDRVSPTPSSTQDSSSSDESENHSEKVIEGSRSVTDISESEGSEVELVAPEDDMEEVIVLMSK